MLSFFPSSHPDELLYSVLARYHAYCSNTSPKMTMMDLYGMKTVTAVVDLPSHMDQLVSRLPACVPYYSEELIIKYTLYPYYSAFLSRKSSSALMKDMKSDFGGDIHASIGIMASSIQAPQFLRFCSECNMEDLSICGENYWHRLHQVPGVLLCPKHEVLLLDSSTNIHACNKHEFIMSDLDNCKPKLSVINLNYSEFEKLKVLSKNVLWLLENYNKSMTADGLREKYIELLKSRGLATVNGRVYQHELTQSFINYYSEPLLRILNLGIDYENENNWLASIVRKHRKVFHPLRHLLMLMFLGQSIEELLKVKKVYSPFGFGPWPCLNIAADHYKKHEVTNLKITHCSDTKLPVGTFECTCGYVYSRRGPDKEKNDLYRIGRIRRFGSVWENKLKELTYKEKLSLREIDKRLNVDAKTVKKYAEKLNLDTFWSTSKNDLKKISTCSEIEKTKIAFEMLKDEYRTTWLVTIENNSNLFKTALRKLVQAEFIWLYRHDREWLDYNSPKKQKFLSVNSRVDWQARDKLALITVKKLVKQLIETRQKPKRITISRIGKETGLLSLLEKHIDKMPLTGEFLEIVKENIEDYQIRRVMWAARLLNEKGEEPKAWKIVRKAGLRTGYTEKVEKAIMDEIANNIAGNKGYKINN